MKEERGERSWTEDVSLRIPSESHMEPAVEALFPAVLFWMKGQVFLPCEEQ